MRSVRRATSSRSCLLSVQSEETAPTVGVATSSVTLSAMSASLSSSVDESAEARAI